MQARDFLGALAWEAEWAPEKVVAEEMERAAGWAPVPVEAQAAGLHSRHQSAESMRNPGPFRKHSDKGR